MPIANPQEKFVHELCLVYDAEHQFVEGQQEMAQEATDQELESAIREHIEQTRLHIRNLEEIFEQLGEQPQRQTSVVAQGLVSEAQQDIQEAQNDAIRDCLIDAAVLKVEHFEMGSYRGMVTGAQQVGQTEIVNLLNENLQQEEEAARIAEQSAPGLLQKAMQEGGQEEGLVDKAKDKLTG